jgi:ABC-2 type transport system permease protein
VLLILTKLYRNLRDRHARGNTGARRRPPHARASRASGGLLELTLHQARYDLRAILRNNQARYSTLILPPLLLVLLVSGLGGGSIGGHGARAAYFALGVSALGVLLACFTNLAVWLSVQRDSGVLKRRRTAPVPAFVLIAGRSLAAMATSLAAVATVLVLAHIAYHVGIPIGALPALAVTAIVGSITFATLAHALSSVIRSADAAQPLVQAIALPLCIASGVFVPDASLPSWLHQLASLFPLEPLADALRHAYGSASHSPALSLSDLAVLIAWAIAGTATALLRFRWTPAHTTA